MLDREPRRSRRTFLKRGAAATIAHVVWRLDDLAAAGNLPVPVRTVTRGPKFHWFAYYDKLQFDPSGRYVLG